MVMNIPTARQLSQAERFVEGLKILASECGLSSVNYNAFGITKFIFEDGTWMGSVRAYINAGYINENKYAERYGD